MSLVNRLLKAQFKHGHLYAGRFTMGNGSISAVDAENCTVTYASEGTVTVAYGNTHSTTLAWGTEVLGAAGGDETAKIIAADGDGLTIETRATPTGVAADAVGLDVCFWAIAKRDR